VAFASPAEYVTVQFAATPLAALVADLDQSERARVLGLVSADVDEALAPYIGDSGLAFPQEVYVTLGTA